MHLHFLAVGTWAQRGPGTGPGSHGCSLAAVCGFRLGVFPHSVLCLQQFRSGGSSAVPEETGPSRIQSEAVFQNALSRLAPWGAAVGKWRRDIDYGWGYGEGGLGWGWGGEKGETYFRKTNQRCLCGHRLWSVCIFYRCVIFKFVRKGSTGSLTVVRNPRLSQPHWLRDPGQVPTPVWAFLRNTSRKVVLGEANEPSGSLAACTVGPALHGMRGPV